ncbi:hypothetical protein DH09_13555 [Bacillaceae bacterium JMAK1]|nr:hypothetical protein DH09_13555 [Bacillaceae bacterium JMAK1]
MYVAQLILSIVSLVQLVSYIISILFVTGFVSFFLPEEGTWMLLLIVAVIVGIPLLLLTLGILGTINLHKKKGRAAKQLLATGIILFALSLLISFDPEFDFVFFISSFFMFTPITIAGFLALRQHRAAKIEAGV